MVEPAHNYTRLPGKLREELGITRAEYDGVRKGRDRPGKRKEQRKAARVAKKTKIILTKRPMPVRRTIAGISDQKTSTVTVEKETIKASYTQPITPKSILKAPKKQSIPSLPSSPPPRISRHVKEKLAEDDAEISALEKVLGVKNKSKLPKSFEQDGLDDLLEGIDEDVSALGLRLGKRKSYEGDEWLENKRQKAWAAMEEKVDSSIDNPSEEEEFLGEFEESNEGGGVNLSNDRDEEIFEGLSGDEEEYGSAKVDENGLRSESIESTKQPRENPYIAPVTSSTELVMKRYIPPSLRTKDSSETENLSRLRKQVQGLLNRLSEANILSIVADVEKLYQTSPRQHVSTTILDVLLSLLSDPSILQDTFIILHTGFIAALYKTLGTEFGAQAIQRIHREFSLQYEKDSDISATDKRLVNLTSLFAYLYNFQVVSNSLIYDLIRLLLNELSETNTELLLKIIRSAGSQLRQDDPSSLKAIVQLLQDHVTKAGENTISTKIRFMMETMNSLKNNRMKTGVVASMVSVEHVNRMRKTLGTLNQKQIKASEPLRITLKDLRESDSRGKWWLIGSSCKDNDPNAVNQAVEISRCKDDYIEDAHFDHGDTGDLMQLAKEQRMNTSIRQSIFIAIMSATDYDDAYMRLMKLHLKNSQQLEIPRVLIHCSGAESTYNPFYTFLARRICSDRKLKMAFQFSLWDLFKRMGEGEEEMHAENEDDDGNLGLRTVVNLARMFGSLIANGGLGLAVLKNLNLAYLQPKTQTFVEVMLITMILQSQKGVRNERAILDVFLTPKEMLEMARGLQYFLKKHVRQSDIAGSKHDEETVKWGCKVATSALAGLMSKDLYNG